MADIKSAWEIAQEKASRLGELSAEEREKQRQERCRLIGESLADKYIGQGDISWLEDQLGKFTEQDRALLRRAAMGRLIKALDLRYPAELAEISRGITALSTSPAASKTLDEIKALFQEYTESEEKERQEIEKSGREILHQLRISGTAVDKLNIRAKEEWQKKLEQISLPFDEKLINLKQELQR